MTVNVGTSATGVRTSAKGDTNVERVTLGERLCQWHSSQGDPIYAVGSYYVSDRVYPDQEVVGDCLSRLEMYLSMAKAKRHPSKRDYEIIADLQELCDSVQQQAKEDY